MKRIALLILAGFSLIACDNKVDPEPGPGPWGPEEGEGKSISLKIHVPPRSTSTYAEEDPSEVENKIDSIFIYLYQAGTFIHEGKFGGSQLDYIGPGDSTILIAYEVDNITTGALTAEVFANKRKPTRLTSPNEVPIPDLLQKSTLFYMSGKCTALTFNTSAYYGEVHIARNVAKLRINIERNSVFFPSDLKIDYPNVKIQVINATDSTTAFAGPSYAETAGVGRHNYIERTDFSGANCLRKKDSAFDDNTGTGWGGLIDSLYLYENIVADDCEANPLNRTQVKITIPTMSATEGSKSMTLTYDLKTALTGYCIKRNHIYTLDIKVRAQNLDPIIMLDILPWNDVDVSGDIPGTYIELNTSEITFDASGRATIDFCSDAQAIYFNFNNFNDQNIPQIGTDITPVGIETPPIASPVLLPSEFQGGQILLDQQHCGSFGFQLNLSAFPQFPNVTFSGSICLKAGNIVKCLTFPAVKTYDAHFIVGDSLFGGELFTKADVTASGKWLEVSTKRLFTTADTTQHYNSTAAQLFLHLDEYIITSGPLVPRTGSITLQNSNTGVSRTINIAQLPAIFVGRFGNRHMDSLYYLGGLYTEQLYEYNSSTMPTWGADGTFPYGDMLFSGILANPSAIDFGRYSSNPANLFDYLGTTYPAFNYCAYKNRGSNNGALVASDIKWYLPAQAQLMAMWISYHYISGFSSSNFFHITQDAVDFGNTTNYWSATPNLGYPVHAQYVNFDYGNVGHYKRELKYLSRCVRNDESGYYASRVAIKRNVSATDYPYLDFKKGFYSSMLVEGSGNTRINNNGAGNGIVTHNESEDQNLRLFAYLRVAKRDLDGGANVPWSYNVCSSFTEAPLLPNTKWRLPTQRELQAIWILQHEIREVMKTGPSTSDFELLSNDYYWSGTNAATTFNTVANAYTNAWTIFGNAFSNYAGAGNAPHQLKDYKYKVRCVMEVSYIGEGF